ncbi:MAG TPA: hypothetical protein VM431_14585 [Phycisphaerae bacterium]|nr:hypothetical protein [Phycisphaerae bacterium]
MRSVTCLAVVFLSVMPLVAAEAAQPGAGAQWALQVQLPDKTTVRIDPIERRLTSEERAGDDGATVTTVWPTLGDGPLADLSVTVTAQRPRGLTMEVANKG